MGKSRVCWGLGLGAFLLLPGCQFSASASGEASTGGETKGEAEASLSGGAEEGKPPPPRTLAQAIKLNEGKLDYEGVINFEYNKANLKADEATENTLSEFKKFLAANPKVKIQVEGHTDSRGSDDYNRKLSDRRAASVRKWLVKNGVSDDRVTSIGKGEDDPQVPEPAECSDKEPEDTTPCEETWAKNRRVVFTVTEGADTVETPAEPTPEPEEPAPVAEPEPAPEPEQQCKWLWGPRLNLLGVNSWVGADIATQPCLDWLEVSLGVGLGFGKVEGDSSAGGADDTYWSLTVPLRARFWPFKVHTPIAELGVGITHYWINVDAEDGAGNPFNYERDSTPFIAHAGVGYGFRPNGPEPGFRLALLIGAVLHLTDLADPTVDAQSFPVVPAAELTDSLNKDTDDLTDLEPYGEISLGWMFD